MSESSDTAGLGRLTVTVSSADGISVISVHGEIDHHTGTPLRKALALPDGVSTPRIVVDLSGVTFMDSTGINILIAAHHTVRDAQGWLRLAAPTANVLSTLQIVGVDSFITCHPTLRDALAG